MKRIHRIIGVAMVAAGLGAIGATVARAVPSAATRHKLSFAGNISPVPAAGTDVLFKLTNGAINCTVLTKPVFASNGDFATELDLSACSTFAFDGGDVTYTIRVGTGAESAAQALNPVPYAKFADRAGRVVMIVGTQQYSVGATKVCGVTSTVFTGKEVGGYAGARLKCQTVPGCSTSAHMCSLEEAARSSALGVPLPAIPASVPPFSATARAAWISGAIGGGPSGSYTNDCTGYTYDGTGANGTCWADDVTGGAPGQITCSIKQAVLCCD